MIRLSAAAVAGATWFAIAGMAAAGSSDSQSAAGCWAQLYKNENFQGEALSLKGPTDIDNIHAGWGFAWNPQFESIAVGPAAELVIYDNVGFWDRTATFKPGRHVADLDDKMGLFRAIRSLKLRCSR